MEGIGGEIVDVPAEQLPLDIVKIGGDAVESRICGQEDGGAGKIAPQPLIQRMGSGMALPEVGRHHARVAGQDEAGAEGEEIGVDFPGQGAAVFVPGGGGRATPGGEVHHALPGEKGRAGHVLPGLPLGIAVALQQGEPDRLMPHRIEH